MDHLVKADLPPEEVRRRASQLRIVFTDVDGVLTDTGVYYSAHGEELKRFSIRDGMGVERLRDAGIATAIITGERSMSVRRRAEKLGIEMCFLGVKQKLECMQGCLADAGVTDGTVAFIGDDVNDLSIITGIRDVGLTAAPADGMPEVQRHVHYVCGKAGGHGAFRDFAEWLLQSRVAAAKEKLSF